MVIDFDMVVTCLEVLRLFLRSCCGDNSRRDGDLEGEQSDARA